MTIFTGVFSLLPNGSVPDILCKALTGAVSRSPGEKVHIIKEHGLFLAHVDIGAFPVSGVFKEADGSSTLVAGEPLIAKGAGDDGWDRSKDTIELHASLKHGSSAGLRECRGTFCGVHFNKSENRILLFVDKTGVRPIYLWTGPEFVVFSTALRVLESLDKLPRMFDLTGVTEIAAYGYPLGDKTAYSEIRTLEAGEMISISGKSLESKIYWRWDGELESPTDDVATVQRTYENFISAIRRRQKKDPVATAFLSGGLDSRAIVGGLRSIGINVATVNFAPDNTQDQVFATALAEKLGIQHTQLNTNASNVSQGYRKKAVADWLQNIRSNTRTPESPGMMWSGDGGSVALGHVYLDAGIAEASKKGDMSRAIMLFSSGISRKIITAAQREKTSSIPLKSGIRELDKYDCKDPIRKFHLFLMMNDQRRHLFKHFEDIDLERIEFQLPFFDSDFLETILRLPAEPFLDHRFYMDWLRCFPNELTSVPWQAYPGHIQCNLPVPPGLKYQWKEYYDSLMVKEMTKKSASEGHAILRSKDFPGFLINRTALSLATWMTSLGIRDLSYLIKTAAIYTHYWNISNSNKL